MNVTTIMTWCLSSSFNISQKRVDENNQQLKEANLVAFYLNTGSAVCEMIQLWQSICGSTPDMMMNNDSGKLAYQFGFEVNL